MPEPLYMAVAVVCFRTIMGARMEPKSAHHVFPCFNEPRFLATFSLSLAVTGSDKEALSVSPLASSAQECVFL